MQFRLIEENELVDFTAFAKATFIRTYAHLNNPIHFQQYIEEAFTIERITKEWLNPDSYFYWKKEKEIPIAYVKLNRGLAQTDPCLPASLEIERIYVDHKFKRKGLGSSMIKLSIEKAASLNLEWVWLGVWKKNPDAIEFYQNQGFEIFSEHIFRIGEDDQLDYLMRRSVKQYNY